LPPLDWHIHEMIYGDVASAVAGFLLTASTNWTGRLPVNGYPLAALFAIWLVGRIGIAVSAICGLLPAVVIDVAFLWILAGVALNRRQRPRELQMAEILRQP